MSEDNSMTITPGMSKASRERAEAEALVNAKEVVEDINKTTADPDDTIPGDRTVQQPG